MLAAENTRLSSTLVCLSAGWIPHYASGSDLILPRQHRGILELILTPLFHLGSQSGITQTLNGLVDGFEVSKRHFASHLGPTEPGFQALRSFLRRPLCPCAYHSGRATTKLRRRKFIFLRISAGITRRTSHQFAGIFDPQRELLHDRSLPYSFRAQELSSSG